MRALLFVALFVISTLCLVNSYAPFVLSTSGDSSVVNSCALQTETAMAEVEKVEKTEEEWREILSEEQYRVLREKGELNDLCGRRPPPCRNPSGMCGMRAMSNRLRISQPGPGTERAGTGEYIKVKKKGKFLCAGCEAELYTTNEKVCAHILVRFVAQC